MSKKVNIIYKLEGEVDEGIDVFTLAPFLLSVAELIKESKETINPGGFDVAVNVKPFEKGSFIIDILLFARSNAQAIIDSVNTEDVKRLKEVLEWVGIIKGSVDITGGGLIALIKHLKGQPKKVEKLDKGEYRYTPKEGTSITVPAETHQLFQNNRIQSLTQVIYTGLLDQRGVDKVTSFINGQKEESEVVVEEEEKSYFKSLSEEEIPSVEDETISNTVELYLNPKRGSFEGDGSSWSFRKGSNATDIITATIKDEAFLEKIQNGKIRLNFRDLLKVRLIEKQKIVGSQVIATHYEIEEVIEYKEFKENRLL